MCAVDRSRHHSIIRLRAELRMSSERVVSDVSQKFDLTRACGEHERLSPYRDDDLLWALPLKFAPLFECGLVEHLDHLPRAFEDNDLFLAEAFPGRGDAIPPSEQIGRASCRERV